LDEISNLEGYIEETHRLLVHLSKGYFESKNCMRELTTAARLKKHVIAILDPDSSHGGLSKDEVHEHLCQAASMYDRWGFMAKAPSGEALFDHVFAHEPIEWDRIGHFQDVTMRLIAEQVVLPEELQGSVMVQDELANQPIDFRPPQLPGKKFHVYCSPRNLGASALLREVAGKHQVSFLDNAQAALRVSVLRRASLTMSRIAQREVKRSLRVTTSLEEVQYCDHMLVYLTSDTWRSGERSRTFGDEVKRAMLEGVHLLLAHEMPGVGGSQTRAACDFSTMFEHEDGATPRELLQAGIYAQIAIPLKDGAWRAVSMVMMAQALCSMGKVQGLGLHAQQRQPAPKEPGSPRTKTKWKFGSKLRCRTTKREKPNGAEVAPAEVGAKWNGTSSASSSRDSGASRRTSTSSDVQEQSCSSSNSTPKWRMGTLSRLMVRRRGPAASAAEGAGASVAECAAESAATTEVDVEVVEVNVEVEEALPAWQQLPQQLLEETIESIPEEHSVP